MKMRPNPPRASQIKSLTRLCVGRGPSVLLPPRTTWEFVGRRVAAHWERLPAERGRESRPAQDNRRYLNGMLYILRGDHADIVAAGADDSEDRIADAALPRASGKATVAFHVPDLRLDGASSPRCFARSGVMPRLVPADQDLGGLHGLCCENQLATAVPLSPDTLTPLPQ